MLSGMILAAFSLFPVLAFSAPSPVSHQIILSPEAHASHGIPEVLFNDFNNLAKIVDITNCLQTPEGISYPFGCNSFCREFPELKLLKQWNDADNLGDSYGYIAISHEKGKERIIIAFAGPYSLTNAVIDLSAIPEDYIPHFSGISSHIRSCPGCKVHGDFYREWLKTEKLIGATVSELVTQYVLGMRYEHPKNIDGKNTQVAVLIAKKTPYRLVLVGHRLGGAVATLAAVEFEARGWNPQVTTFGQPKVGNEAFTDYLTGKFTPSTYRRVTHVNDPVPLFPPGLSHYEHEYFISKEFVPYTAADVRICNADITCETRVDIGNALDLNWGASDYFHHTDTCVREPVSFFSFSTSFFIIDLGNLGFGERSNTNPQLHSVLETITEELEGDGDSTTEFEKPQSIWNKKNNQKRSIDPNTKLVKPIPDSKFAKTFAMVEPPPPKPPPEYEDEELYHAMSGFNKAQGMWVKPQKKASVTKPQKRTIDLDVSFVKPIPDSKFKKTFAMVEPPEPEPEEEVYVPQYEDEEIYNAMSGFKTAQSMWVKPRETPEKEKRKSNLVTRGLDRALRFFHAPKEVLNAQLAANDRSAAYEAQQKVQQNPQSKLEEKPSGTKVNTKPDEDYVKKGGSVLMLNGRPLEIDGRPVGSLIQKRGTGHHPGLGLRNRPKHGGIKRGGGGDKVTELSSSSPPATKSNSRVGVVENAVPNSLKEEVVDVKKGENFVLTNGRRTPPSFSKKSVSTKPTKRSYIPEDAEKRLRDPEELVFSSVQQAQGRRSRIPELMRRPKKYYHKPERGFNATSEHASSASGEFRKPNNIWNLDPKEEPEDCSRQLENKPEHHHEEAPDSIREDKFSIPEAVFHSTVYHHRPDGSFGVVDQHSRGPEEGLYLTQDRSENYYRELEGQHSRGPEEGLYLAQGRSENYYRELEGQHSRGPKEGLYLTQGRSENYYREPEGHYRQHEDYFRRSKDHFAIPERRFRRPEGHFHAPQEKFYHPDQDTYGGHIPGKWEMWEIQGSRAGPFTHTLTNAYTGELPREDGDVRYSYSYS